MNRIFLSILTFLLITSGVQAKKPKADFLQFAKYKFKLTENSIIESQSEENNKTIELQAQKKRNSADMTLVFVSLTDTVSIGDKLDISYGTDLAPNTINFNTNVTTRYKGSPINISIDDESVVTGYLKIISIEEDSVTFEYRLKATELKL